MAVCRLQFMQKTPGSPIILHLGANIRNFGSNVFERLLKGDAKSFLRMRCENSNPFWPLVDIIGLASYLSVKLNPIRVSSKY